MHKFILEVCGGNREPIHEPACLETRHDHDGEIAAPIVVTARGEDEPENLCPPFIEASPAAHHF